MKNNKTFNEDYFLERQRIEQEYADESKIIAIKIIIIGITI